MSDSSRRSTAPAHDPFTTEQQRAIQRWQDRGDVHPLTCPVESTHGDLVPREDGLHCPACDAVQTWCPWFIAEGL